MNIKHVLPAIWLLVTVAASVAVTPTHAQTLDQNFSKQLSVASKRIFSSPLSPEYQEHFYGKLLQITAESSCREIPSKQPRAFECSGAQPTSIEATLAKIEKLNVEMNATFALVGTQTVRYVYDRKLNDLKEKMRAGRIDGAEAKPLLERVATFFGSTDPKRLLNVAEVDAKYQMLAADVDAAIKLSAASQSTSTFLMQYQEKVKALQNTIDRSKLNPVTQGDLKNDLAMLSAPMLRPGARFTPAEFAKADVDLNAFNTRIEQTILVEGSKSFKDIATLKLDVLGEKLRVANLEPKEVAPLQTNIASLRKQIDDVTVSILKQKGRVSLDSFESRLANLSAEIDATITLAAARGQERTLLEAFSNKARALNTKVEQSRINAFFHNDFLLKVANASASVNLNCGRNAPNKTGPSGACDFGALFEADKQLDALSSTVDKIIATYGANSVQVIYGMPANEALGNLNKSQVGAVDKKRLSQNLSVVVTTIQAADRVNRLPPGRIQTTAGRNSGVTPEQLHNDVTTAIGEIDAAIRLTAKK